MKTLRTLLATLLVALFAISAAAQFNLDGQILQRTEFRNGYNRLLAQNLDPAFFIAHRARLQAGYKLDKVQLYLSVQDVRTWGNTSQIKVTDPYLSVHEAWGEIWLSDHFSLKLGRQELNYDNFRFLGNLDWALQARAHDFALVKYEKEDMKLHLGGGYNQDAQNFSGTLFTTTNQYKVAQLFRYENRIGELRFSLLFWNDGRQYTLTGPQGTIIEKGVRYRQTIGIPTLKYEMGNTTLSAFYYHQLGKDPVGKTVAAYDASLQLMQQIGVNKEAGQKLRLVAGAELLSGSEPGAADNNSFSPLYGTNHLFNGYMDHFFVSGAYENNAGLLDVFLRARYDFGPRFFLQLDGHHFSSQVEGRHSFTGQPLGKYLGIEADMSLGFIIYDAVSLQCGFSALFATENLSELQLVRAPDDGQYWAYAMLIYRPTMKNKFIGILL